MDFNESLINMEMELIALKYTAEILRYTEEQRISAIEEIKDRYFVSIIKLGGSNE